MGDYIPVTRVVAHVQENGLIGEETSGHFLGRLEGIKYEEVKKISTNKIIIDADKLEHLLNCMDNQKFIHEQKPATQKEWQSVIDKANREMREILIEQMTKNENH